MDSIEKVISTTFEDLDQIQINVNEKTELIIQLDNCKYEFIINMVENEDNILIFSPSDINAAKARESVNKAIFFEEMNLQIPYNTIYFNDPTRYDYKWLNNGWGVGSINVWHLENIAKIIKKLSYIITDYRKMTISEYSNIYLYGKSMGGFIFIMLSILIKNSTSISDNPPTNLFNHSKLNKITNNCFKNLTPNQIRKYSYRLNVIEMIHKEKYVPNCYIFYDISDNKSWETQCTDFLNQLNNLPFVFNNNKININFEGFTDSTALISDYILLNRIKNIIDIKSRKNLANPIKYHMLSEFKKNLDNIYEEYTDNSIYYSNFIKQKKIFMKNGPVQELIL